MKVPKKPLASWMTLVAMISVPICARIELLDGISLHFSRGRPGNHTARPHPTLPESCLSHQG